jgi:pyrophosphate--fructose-6-phosphate 1-phosphotransferase
MGRNCGWLTAATAVEYRKLLDNMSFVPGIGLSRERKEVHGVYIPEMAFDGKAEAERLRKIMDEHDCVNIFISEGAGLETIIAEMEARGEEVQRDAFGHPRLDKINPGAWFGKRFAEMLGAEKTLVQKSGYYSRAAASNAADKALIIRCAHVAVDCAFTGVGGVVGEDENRDGELRACEFERIKGGKPFDIDAPWFNDLLVAIGQPKGARVDVEH